VYAAQGTKRRIAPLFGGSLHGRSAFKVGSGIDLEPHRLGQLRENPETSRANAKPGGNPVLHHRPLPGCRHPPERGRASAARSRAPVLFRRLRRSSLSFCGCSECDRGGYRRDSPSPGFSGRPVPDDLGDRRHRFLGDEPCGPGHPEARHRRHGYPRSARRLWFPC
jgi:hypothetical protein